MVKVIKKSNYYQLIHDGKMLLEFTKRDLVDLTKSIEQVKSGMK